MPSFNLLLLSLYENKYVFLKSPVTFVPLNCKLLLKLNEKDIVFLIKLIVVVQLSSHVSLFATSQTAARQASLSFIISQSLFKLMSIESAMPSNHLILCRPLLLFPSIFPNIRVFSNESALYQLTKVL